MQRVFTQMWKELRQTFRDRLTVALALGLPLVLVVLLGTAISLSVKGIDVAVQDLDRTPLSRKYIDAINSSLTFKVTPLPLDVTPAEALASNSTRIVIVIPSNFERMFTSGSEAEVQWLIDAVDANTANVIRGQAKAITQSVASSVSDSGNRQSDRQIKVEMRLWYNPGGDSNKFIGPGVFAVVLAFFPPLLAALAMSREGEQKTILQVFVSGITAHEFLLGKILAFFVIAIAEWVLTLIASVALFGLKFAGDPTPLLVGTVAYLLCNVAFGVMVGVAVPNQAAAIQAVSGVQFLLSFLLSGFIFPLANVPAGLRWISAVVPSRYFIEISRDAFVRGGGWPAVWQAPVMLTLSGLVFFFVAWKKMQNMQVEA